LITFETQRLILKSLSPDDAILLQRYLVKNKDFLEEWEPERNEGYYSLDSIAKSIETNNAANENKSGLNLYLFKKAEENIIGNIGLSNIIYGVFQSCYLGYKLDVNEINNGYMGEGLKKEIEIAFENYKLHRIEANVMPRNIKSIRVLEKLEFENEGISRQYLKINGKWEDHMRFVLFNNLAE